MNNKGKTIIIFLLLFLVGALFGLGDYFMNRPTHGYYYEMKNLIIPVLQEVLNIGGVQNGQE